MHSMRYCLKKTSSVFPEALANRLTVAMIDGGKEKSGLRDDDTSIMFFVALLYVVKNMQFLHDCQQ